MLDDLELGVALEGKPTTFKQVEQFLLSDVLVVDEVLFFVGLAVVAFAHDKVIGFDGDPSLRVVQSNLDKVDLGILLGLGLLTVLR